MNSITFGSLNLHPDLLGVLSGMDMKPLSEVEARVIPVLLQGKSAVVVSPTGTGKTFSYLVPMVDYLLRNGTGIGTRFIVVVPTAVLAIQVKTTLEDLAKRSDLKPFRARAYSTLKEASASNPPDVAVVTPAQFRPLTRAIDATRVAGVVFDEGDMILFDGFMDEMEQACRLLPGCGKSFFSASLSPQWLTRVKRMCGAEEVIDLSQGRINGFNIAHILVDLRGATREQGLAAVLSDEEVASGQVLVFVSRKEELEEALRTVRKLSIPAAKISGELDRRGIARAVSDFTSGEYRVLVATDYASRGLDLPSVRSVISYTLPKDQGYYFHRAGRSGRFDTPGFSYVLCGKDDLDSCRALQRKGAGFRFAAVKQGRIIRVKSAPVSHRANVADTPYLKKAAAEVKRKHPLGKVKPGYKKKVREAIRVAKIKHKKKIVRTNLNRKGTQSGS